MREWCHRSDTKSLHWAGFNGFGAFSACCFLTVLKQKQSRACYTREISRLLKAALGERVYTCVSIWIDKVTPKWQSSGAVWLSRWPSWANSPYGLCGHKAILKWTPKWQKGQYFDSGHLQEEEEIIVPTSETPELSKIPSFKHGAGQNVALNASSAARNYSFFIFAFLLHSTLLFAHGLFK